MADALASQNDHPHVLVVDDEDVVRSILSRFLQRRGYQVTLACSGREGLEKVTHAVDAFDLVILDMIMPGMTGDAVLEGVRRVAPGLPVVIFSGHADTDLCTSLLNRGATAVVAKRTPFERLLQVCGSAINDAQHN